MTADLLLLAVLWCLWCALHSLFIVEPVKSRVLRRFKFPPNCYRLCYNLFALISLLPILFWTLHLSMSAPLVAWDGPLRLVQGLFWMAAWLLAWFGARAYPLEAFLGLDCLRSARPQAAPVLATDGVLGLVRHPWYLAALLVLWSRDLNAPALVSSTILSGYLLLGASVEERRLLKVFGSAYADYRRRVPMLIPWRWPMERMRRFRR